MDRSELAKLKQKQGTASVDSSTNVEIRNATPSPAVDVDAQDIYIKGVRSGQRVIKDHALLAHLDYASSGHTGFAGIEFGTTAQWNARPTYRPAEGILLVYTDYVGLDGQPIMNFKIGDGNAYLVDLKFINQDLRASLEQHINDWQVHVSEQDRRFWNNKINCLVPESEEDLLEFTREDIEI